MALLETGRATLAKTGGFNECKNKMENLGIDPSASRMLSERSTI